MCLNVALILIISCVIPKFRQIKGGQYYTTTTKMAGLKIVLLLLGAVAVAKAQNCGQILQGTIIADSNNCNSYLVCDEGILLSHSCPSGQNYNPVDQMCEYNYNCANQVFTTETVWLYPNQVSNGDINSNPCYGMPNGSYAPVEYSCTQFYYCMNGGATIGNCPTGYGFSSYYNGCVYGNTNC